MDRIIKREIWGRLKDELGKKEITILLGPRQTGKTTLILQLIDYLERQGVNSSFIYKYNFDDVDLRAKVKRDFYFIQKDIEQKLGYSIESVKNKLYIFLDEGQKSPTVFELVKIFFDTGLNLKIFISGSSSINIKDKSVETLSGRVNYFYLSPLTFTEAVGTDFGIYRTLENIKDVKEVRELASAAYRKEKEYRNLFTKMLFWGGMPKIHEEDSSESLKYLNNFMSSYLDKDIKDIGAKVDIESFHLSFKYLSSYCADQFNFSKLGSDLGIKRDSLYRYFELLEKTLVIKTVLPFIFPELRNIFKSRKLFFFDNGVVNRLRGFLTFTEVERAGFTGKIFENLVFQNLNARSLNDLKKPDFYYFRDYQNHEIDFVYQRGDVIIPIEAHYSSSIENRTLRNFANFFSNAKAAKYGIVFYSGDIKEYRVMQNKVYALPFFLI